MACVNYEQFWELFASSATEDQSKKKILEKDIQKQKK